MIQNVWKIIKKNLNDSEGWMTLIKIIAIICIGFQYNQGTEFLGRFSQKVGRFDILQIKCCILDNFSYNVMQKCQKR